MYLRLMVNANRLYQVVGVVPFQRIREIECQNDGSKFVHIPQGWNLPWKVRHP